jgi:hypothetical protein
MSWLIDLIMYILQGGFKTSDLFVVPIPLFGPPLALPVFGVGAMGVSRIQHPRPSLTMSHLRPLISGAHTCP